MVRACPGTTSTASRKRPVKTGTYLLQHRPGTERDGADDSSSTGEKAHRNTGTRESSAMGMWIRTMKPNSERRTYFLPPVLLDEVVLDAAETAAVKVWPATTVADPEPVAMVTTVLLAETSTTGTPLTAEIGRPQRLDDRTWGVKEWMTYWQW